MLHVCTYAHTHIHTHTLYSDMPPGTASDKTCQIPWNSHLRPHMHSGQKTARVKQLPVT